MKSGSESGTLSGTLTNEKEFFAFLQNKFAFEALDSHRIFTLVR